MLFTALVVAQKWMVIRMDEYIKLGDVLRVFAQKQQEILGYDRYYYLSPDKKDEYDLYTILTDDIENIPVADVAEVVRCKDCKHRDKAGLCQTEGQKLTIAKDNHFCSYGERKED